MLDSSPSQGSTAVHDALGALSDWYEQFRSRDGEEPDRYVVCAGLVISERFREVFPLQREDYVTEKNQLRGSGGPAIRNILARFGEHRRYLSEGGRTTRGSVPAGESLVGALNSIETLIQLEANQRTLVADEMQRWLTQRASEFFERQRIELEIDAAASMEAVFKQILDHVRESGGHKSGAVAQHLVGAKLAIRFEPLGISVENHSATAADLQTGRSGDFRIGDTVFHVTLSPNTAVIAKCKENLRNGLRVVLLVPDDSILAAKQMAELEGILDRVSFGQSLAGFIGQNIEELGAFSKIGISHQLRDLLQTYNKRVAEAETDRSLLFEIPLWLFES